MKDSTWRPRVLRSVYQDIEWILPHHLPDEDVKLPAGYLINPDETEENSISGPQKDKLLDLFEELNTPPLTEEFVDNIGR